MLQICVLENGYVYTQMRTSKGMRFSLCHCMSRINITYQNTDLKSELEEKAGYMKEPCTNTEAGIGQIFQYLQRTYLAAGFR